MELSKKDQKHISDVICKMYEVHDVDFYEQVFLKLPSTFCNDMRSYIESNFNLERKPKQKLNVMIPEVYKCTLCYGSTEGISCFVTNSRNEIYIHIAEEHLAISLKHYHPEINDNTKCCFVCKVQCTDLKGVYCHWTFEHRDDFRRILSKVGLNEDPFVIQQGSNFACILEDDWYYLKGALELDTYGQDPEVASIFEKKKRCEKCHKFVSSKDALKKHLTLHDPESRVKCPDCNKTFSGPYYVTRHYRAKHLKQRYGCPNVACGKTYARTDALNVHLDTKPECGNFLSECDNCQEILKGKQILLHVKTCFPILSKLCPIEKSKPDEVMPSNEGSTDDHEFEQPSGHKKKRYLNFPLHISCLVSIQSQFTGNNLVKMNCTRVLIGWNEFRDLS